MTKSNTRVTRVTRELLIDAGACDDQVAEFVRRFPDGTDVTVELCRRHAEEFDFGWAADNLLTVQARERYEAVQRPAWEQYKAVQRPTWDQYKAARRSAMERYKSAQAVAFAEAVLKHGMKT